MAKRRLQVRRERLTFGERWKTNFALFRQPLKFITKPSEDTKNAIVLFFIFPFTCPLPRPLFGPRLCVSFNTKPAHSAEIARRQRRVRAREDTKTDIFSTIPNCVFSFFNRFKLIRMSEQEDSFAATEQGKAICKHESVSTPRPARQHWSAASISFAFE